MVPGITSLRIILMHKRGRGGLKLDFTLTVDQIEHPTGRLLCEGDHNEEGKYYYPFRPGESIFTEEHLRRYLVGIK